jgi:hypothetical protein
VSACALTWGQALQPYAAEVYKAYVDARMRDAQRAADDAEQGEVG